MIAKIASAIITAIKVIGSIVGKAYRVAAIPAKVAGSIALRAGASTKTAQAIQTIAKVGTAIAADKITGVLINKTPKFVSQPLKTINRALIIKNIL